MGSQKQNLGDQVPAPKGETESMKHKGLCNNKRVSKVLKRKFYLRKILINFLPINLNMCFGFSKKTSH